MNPRDDRRGVSTVVGAVLIFAILIVLLSLYQAQVVPAQNEAAEFQHSQEVQTDLLHLRDGLLRTAASGNAYPTSVALGTRYPTRIFFVNPPPVSGRLTTETVGDGRILVANVEALDAETDDYWNGDNRTFDSKSLVYEAEYTYLENSPRRVYGNTLLYANYTRETPNAYVVDAGPTVVDGDHLKLVALGGNLARSGVGSTSVDPQPVSAPFTEITVTNANAGENVTVTLPTSLPAERWRTLLADEFDPDGQDDTAADGYLLAVRDTGAGTVELVLEPDTYTLQMAKLGVGTGVSDPGAHYVTALDGDGATVREGQSTPLVAQVRDRFNNPVGGVTVSVQGNPSVTPSSTTTDDRGRATFSYNAQQDGDSNSETVTVTVGFGGANTAREQASFTVYVVDDDGGGGGGPTTADASQVTYDKGSVSADGTTLSFGIDAKQTVHLTKMRVDTRQWDEGAASEGTPAVTVPQQGSATIQVGKKGVYKRSFPANDELLDVSDETFSGTQTVVIENFDPATVGDDESLTVTTSPPLGRYVAVTFEFNDGSSKTFYFSPG